MSSEQQNTRPSQEISLFTSNGTDEDANLSQDLPRPGMKILLCS